MAEEQNNEIKPFEGIALLNYLQVNLKVPKNQYNKFGGYKYRALEDIDEALKPLLQMTGAAKTRTAEIVLIGNRYYVKVTSSLYDYKGNLVAETVGYAREAENKKGMDVSQITGASISYAAKYAEAAMFCLDDTQDADATNTHNEEDNNSKPKNIQQKQTNNNNGNAVIRNRFLETIIKLDLPKEDISYFSTWMNALNYQLRNDDVKIELLNNQNKLKGLIKDYLETKQTVKAAS